MEASLGDDVTLQCALMMYMALGLFSWRRDPGWRPALASVIPILNRGDDHPMELNMEGGCTCRQVRYRLIGRPLIVHACHCRWCQRETGTAHALNALYEADRVVHTSGEPELVITPTASGRDQKIARCPTCRVAVWSNYPQAGPAVRFVRVGTIDNPDLCPPDIHIYTSSKQSWVTLPAGARAVPEFYDLDAVWPAESLERRRLMRATASRA
jgi:hypothetical protein